MTGISAYLEFLATVTGLVTTIDTQSSSGISISCRRK
jgi:hypothetical protein